MSSWFSTIRPNCLSHFHKFFLDPSLFHLYHLTVHLTDKRCITPVAVWPYTPDDYHLSIHHFFQYTVVTTWPLFAAQCFNLHFSELIASPTALHHSETQRIISIKLLAPTSAVSSFPAQKQFEDGSRLLSSRVGPSLHFQVHFVHISLPSLHS